MPQFNNLDLRATAGMGAQDRQREDFNALRIDAAKQQQKQFSEDELMGNTRWLAGGAKYLLENWESPGVRESLSDEGRRRGVLEPGFDMTNVSREDVQGIYDSAMVALGGDQTTADYMNTDIPSDVRSTMWLDQNPDKKQLYMEAKRNQPGLDLKEIKMPDGSTQMTIWDEQSGVAYDWNGQPINVPAPTAPGRAGVPQAGGAGVPQAPETGFGRSQTPRAAAAATEQGKQDVLGTKGQAAIDAAFAPEYMAFVQGGFSDAQKGLVQLQSVQAELKAGKDLTGWKIAATPDIALSVTNPEALQAREQVEEVVQRNLRLILGAQFTEKEGVRLIARAYNPWLEEKYNLIRINRLLAQIENGLTAKVAMVRYFEQNQTLAGYEAPLLTLEDFHATLDKQAVIEPGESYKGYTYIGPEDGDRSDRTLWQKNSD